MNTNQLFQRNTENAKHKHQRNSGIHPLGLESAVSIKKTINAAYLLMLMEATFFQLLVYGSYISTVDKCDTPSNPPVFLGTDIIAEYNISKKILE